MRPGCTRYNFNDCNNNNNNNNRNQIAETQQPNYWKPTTKSLKTSKQLWRPAKVNVRCGERPRLCPDAVGDCWSVNWRKMRLACPRTWGNERGSTRQRARTATRAGEKDGIGRNPKGHAYPNIVQPKGIVWMEGREEMSARSTHNGPLAHQGRWVFPMLLIPVTYIDVGARHPHYIV